jgi:hypothetical protein
MKSIIRIFRRKRLRIPNESLVVKFLIWLRGAPRPWPGLFCWVGEARACLPEVQENVWWQKRWGCVSGEVYFYIANYVWHLTNLIIQVKFL